MTIAPAAPPAEMTIAPAAPPAEMTEQNDDRAHGVEWLPDLSVELP